MNKLIFAASDSNADMFYATGFSVPDPFLFLEVRGRTLIVLSDLEVDRGRRDARVDEVLSLSELEAAQKGSGRTKLEFADVAAALMKGRRVGSVTVPRDFPLGLAVDLTNRGIRIVPAKGAIWPEREFKSDAEIQALQKASRITESGLARAMEVLAASDIGKGRRLIWGGGTLTAERLRAEIESALLRAGGVGQGTIVAGGEQACDPHERGHGPLKANELIILDIFPRDSKTGYHGDMTRTVVRGQATEAQQRLWQTVLDGQQIALKSIAPRVKGLKLQDAVRKFFTDAGYPTTRDGGRWQGFFHGLGHGLGLEVHEAPRIGATTFRAGQVVTVEPGLYVPGVGGVRHEDVVVVTENGNRILSRFPKNLVI